MFQRKPPLDSHLQTALTRIHQLVGPLVSNVADFERQLAEPVRHALAYCNDLVMALPGPIAIDRRAFAVDPLVHAFFASPQDIEQMLGRSQPLRDYLGTAAPDGGDYFHALFATRRREKKTLGVAMSGDILRRDVEQTLLYFSDHTLAAVATDQESTREHLRSAAFDSLLMNFTSHVDHIRHERQGLHYERDLAQDHLRGGQLSERDDQMYHRRIAELDERIRQSTESLQPRLLVDALIDCLSEPNQSLRLDPVEIRVDRNGVIADTPDNDSPTIDVLDFPELIGRDRRRHVVMLACIPRAEAEHAIAKVEDEQRRFILI